MKTLQIRPYHSDSDLVNMLEILVRGRQAGTAAYYVHPGDLKWWLFYLERGSERRETISLWEDRAGQVVAWMLLSKLYHTFDLFVHPDHCPEDLKPEILGEALSLARKQINLWGGKQAATMWVSERDPWLIDQLTGNGFSPGEVGYISLEADLHKDIPLTHLPGFRLRSLAGQEEAERLAQVSHAAFSSRTSFEHYCHNYRSFLQDTAGVPDRIGVIETPEGIFAAFVINWLDPVNRQGYIEPLGVHPQYQKQGLGRMLLLESMRWMKSEGMQKACICVEHENLPALHLYQSSGFQQKLRLLTFECPLT